MLNEKTSQNLNRIIASLPVAHLLQTQQWAQVKSQVGWYAATRVWGDPEKPDAATLILNRTISLTPLGPKLRIMYLPKGPLLRDWGDQKLRECIFDELIALARKKGAIFIKIDPDVPLGGGIPGTID